MKEVKSLLKKLLDKEIEELRIRFFPYKRRPFLRNDVNIDTSEKSTNVLGTYENTKNEDNEYKYIHKITISSYAVDYYKKLSKLSKRDGIKYLRDILKHELIHAFVTEEFSDWRSIKNCEGDYSPIFLSCLLFARGNSGHPYTNTFLNTELGSIIAKCMDYGTVYLHLINYIGNLENTVRNINKNIQSEHKELNVQFNLYGAGIKKEDYIKATVVRSKGIESIELLNLGIGFLVDSNKLVKSYKDKFSNGSIAKYHKVVKSYYANNELLKSVVVFDNTNLTLENISNISFIDSPKVGK